MLNMDSPLNSAHVLSRKAERFLNLAQFEDAVQCHQKAADELNKAMSLSSSDLALESLKLQRDDHIRQEKVIQLKQHQYELCKKKQESEKNQEHSNQNGGISDNSNSQGSDEIDFSYVHRTILETDSLLHFLEDRCMSGESTYNPPTTGTSNLPVKMPKDDKLVIEELSIHNGELRKHIKLLLEELDIMKKDNDDLRQQVKDYKKLYDTEKDSSNPERFLTLDLERLSTVDLPPLEVPTFDFNSFEQQIENGDVAGEENK